MDLNFYNDGPNVLTEYDDNFGYLTRKHIHGTSFVDERAILVDGRTSGVGFDTYYYLLQELDTVTGLITKNGTLAEAYTYDAYGKVTLWGYRNFDFDRDGDVDSTDYGIVLYGVEFGSGAGSPAADPMTDGDMDGDCDEDDVAMVQQTSSGAPPVTLYTSGVGNPYFFTGSRLHLIEDYALGGSVTYNKQVQYNRARHYDVENGRWLQREPAEGIFDLWPNRFYDGGPSFRPRAWFSEYVDGMNHYEYVRSRSAFYFDPSGLEAVPDCQVRIRLDHYQFIDALEPGNSECSAWGNVACYGDKFNYEQCKDKDGNPEFDRGNKPKLCPKPGLIPGFPNIPEDQEIGPGKDERKFRNILQEALLKARPQGEALAKDCKCKCTQIVVFLECTFIPTENDKTDDWYKHYCASQNFSVNPDGSIKGGRETFRGKMHGPPIPCKKKKKPDQGG